MLLMLGLRGIPRPFCTRVFENSGFVERVGSHDLQRFFRSDGQLNIPRVESLQWPGDAVTLCTLNPDGFSVGPNVCPPVSD